MRKTSNIVVALLAILVCSCNKEAPKNKKEAEAIPVNYMLAHDITYNDELVLTGTFFANKEANLGAAMPGKIEKFHYSPGTYVEAGTLLVELSAELLTQAIIEREALQKDFNRVDRLYQKGSVAEIEYDHLKAKLEAAEVRAEMIKKNTSVTAPFSGVIVEYLVEEGENYFFNINLEPGYSNTSGILRLMQLNPLKVNIEVNEKDLRFISEGDKVVVVCDAYPSDTLTGTIHYIKPILSTITRTATTEISISNPENKIKPGMFARVFITKAEQHATVVPLNAIYRQPGTPEDYVYILKNDTAYRQRIVRLKTLGGQVAVDSVQPGDTVATQGKNRLIHKANVQLVNFAE